MSVVHWSKWIVLAESQKGINITQGCSTENQKGTIDIDFVHK